MQYAYFVGCLILAAAYFIIYIFRKDLRKEMKFGGFLAAPFALTEMFFVPEYWSPPSLFNLISRFQVGIEDVLLCFFIGGIAAVIFEFIENKKTVKIKTDHKKHFLPYAVTVVLIIILELFFPETTIYNGCLALLLGAILMGMKRRDLINQIFFGGLFFAAVYFLLFLVFNLIFPEFISNIYNLANFWGIDIWGVPLEEILFAFSAGAFWATLFEFIKGYRVAKV